MKNLLIISIFFVFGCGKIQPDVPTPVLPAEVKFQFESVVHGNPINLDDTEFENSLGQKYTVSAWKYFISNIEFYNSGKLIFKEPNSYHYISQADESSLEFSVFGVPADSFDEIRYSFGIDEASNNSEARGGDLDIPNGMLWPMGGYRFSNFDGESGSNALAFHIGGNSNFKTLIFDEGINLEVEEGKTSFVHNMVNIGNMFDGVNKIDFSSTPNLATENTTSPLAQNLETGVFMIHHIENPQ